MFDDMLIESANRDRQRGGWVTSLISTALHVGMVGALIAAGYWARNNPTVVEKPIRAFMVASAPPPPPPPPPPAASSATPSQPKVTPVEQPQQEPTFHQPVEIPREVPRVEVPTDTTGGQPEGVPGGQVGGVAGGVVGGVVGGVIGGTMGGQLGGTGDRPLRVGGDVQAPVALSRAEPDYTEPARKARTEGVVFLEAIIDTAGNVTDIRVLKGLPYGLNESAMDAVKKWKFRPGTLNGKAVPVVLDLTISFHLQ
jgi:periplasmic protein TonB